MSTCVAIKGEGKFWFDPVSVARNRDFTNHELLAAVLLVAATGAAVYVVRFRGRVSGETLRRLAEPRVGIPAGL